MKSDVEYMKDVCVNIGIRQRCGHVVDVVRLRQRAMNKE